MAEPCTENRALAKAAQARLRARATARRVKNRARAQTPEGRTGNLQRSWECKREPGGVWVVRNTATYAQYVEIDRQMLLAAARKYLPVVHVDAEYDPVSVELRIVPWDHVRIMGVECRSRRGELVALPVPPVLTRPRR